MYKFAYNEIVLRGGRPEMIISVTLALTSA